MIAETCRLVDFLLSVMVYLSLVGELKKPWSLRLSDSILSLAVPPQNALVRTPVLEELILS